MFSRLSLYNIRRNRCGTEADWRRPFCTSWWTTTRSWGASGYLCRRTLCSSRRKQELIVACGRHHCRLRELYIRNNSNVLHTTSIVVFFQIITKFIAYVMYWTVKKATHFSTVAILKERQLGYRLHRRHIEHDGPYAVHYIICRQFHRWSL